MQMRSNIVFGIATGDLDWQRYPDSLVYIPLSVSFGEDTPTIDNIFWQRTSEI